MHALPTAPLRHSDTGDLCGCINPQSTEDLFPGVHHTPTHCRPVRARSGSSPAEYLGRHRIDVFRVGTNVFRGTRFEYSTTNAVPVTR